MPGVKFIYTFADLFKLTLIIINIATHAYRRIMRFNIFV